MAGFKDTTKTVAGHHNVPAEQFHTFGRERLATGGLINRLARGGPVPEARDDVHGKHETRQVPDKFIYGEDHALVHRRTPSTGVEEAAGGKGPLLPGYKGGGRSKHFHVHKHYYMGGKVTRTEHQSYPKNLAGKAGPVQGSKRFGAARNAGGFGTAGKKPGKTRDKLAKGGHCETGETQNKMAKGGKWIKGAIKHPGALHRTLGVPEGKKIPAGKLEAARHSSNPTTRRRANLAKTLKGFAKGGHIHDCTQVVAPNYKTGGTVNKMAAGGALYNKGGHSKEMSEHLESEAPRGHKGLRELIQRGGR